MVRAFDGPMPMLTMVMPVRSGRVRWYAGICGRWRGGGRSAAGRSRRGLGVITSPGSTKLAKSSPSAIARSA